MKVLNKGKIIKNIRMLTKLVKKKNHKKKIYV